MDLNFGSVTHLPTPLQPTDRLTQDDESERVARYYDNLSDFSDYDDNSSAESRGHVSVSDNEGSRQQAGPSDIHLGVRQNQVEQEDPFADPFAG